LLDAKEVGKRMILSPRTVSEMALKELLPFYRIGIFKRFKWVEIEKYLEASCRCGPTTPKAETGNLKTESACRTGH
jgi:hypothetical protein